LDDIKGLYNAKKHPDVISGKKTEDEVLTEFLETFDIHHANLTGDHQLNSPIITFDEFLEYYTNVSSSIDDDDYFALMMTNAWNLNNVTYAKAWGSNEESSAPTKAPPGKFAPRR